MTGAKKLAKWQAAVDCTPRSWFFHAVDGCIYYIFYGVYWTSELSRNRQAFSRMPAGSWFASVARTTSSRTRHGRTLSLCRIPARTSPRGRPAQSSKRPA